MSDLSINIHDSVKITDIKPHIRVEANIGALIYKEQFEKHKAKYLASKREAELIFTFLFLQIYVECFLHQNMREILQFEFKPPQDNVYTDWITYDNEKRSVQIKLGSFASIFFNPISPNIQPLIDFIIDRFVKITDIRNLFAHGHKIAHWSDSQTGSGVTKARSFLTEIQLDQSIAEINELGDAWNLLADEIFKKCQKLKKIDDFKFKYV